jgi:hypothetical protein
MARGTPTYFTGQITGTAVRNDFYAALRTQIGTYQSNSTNAWEEYEVLNSTPGTRDIVFRSLGDRTLVSGAGDAGLFVRLTEVTTLTIDIKVYQDWSTLDSAGAREASNTTYLRWTLPSNTADLDYWGAQNEYEFALIARQSSTFRVLHFGSPQRTHVPSDGRGVGFTTGAATAGSSVVLSVDRNFSSSLTVGQKIWIYNQTAAGNTLESSTVEIVEVEAVSTSTVTIDTLAANKATGAIIGLDPCPMFGFFYLSTIGSYYMPNLSDGSDGTATTAGLAWMSALITEANHDPGNSGLYHGLQGIMVNPATGKGDPRGISELLTIWPEGTQVDEDRMLTDYAGSASGAWKVFPSISGVAGWATAVGPGATA